MLRFGKSRFAQNGEEVKADMWIVIYDKVKYYRNRYSS